MRELENLARLLVDLGLGKTEASCYIQLLLTDRGPVTAYHVAKKLGKNPNTVYNALDDLEKRGAVEVSMGRGKEYRPIAPEQLTDILKKDYESRIQYTRAHLHSLPRPCAPQEVLQVPTVGAAQSRFTRLLSECRKVAVVDLAPAVLDHFRLDLARALARGVTVIARLYEEPDNEYLAKNENFIFTVEPDGPVMLQLMPGQVLRGVFDCHTQLMTYLPDDWAPDLKAERHRPLAQAMWTASPLLAYQAHNGLAGEIIHTELRAMLQAGNAPDEMQARQDWLARKIHQPVDWEEFWRGAGLVADTAGPASIIREQTPWGRDYPQQPRSNRLDSLRETPAGPRFMREPGPRWGRPNLAEELLARKRRAVR